MTAINNVSRPKRDDRLQVVLGVLVCSCLAQQHSQEAVAPQRKPRTPQGHLQYNGPDGTAAMCIWEFIYMCVEKLITADHNARINLPRTQKKKNKLADLSYCVIERGIYRAN